MKNRQERILWELESPKKREEVFWRFSGTNLFKSECLNFLEYMSENDLEKYLSKFVNMTYVYYIGNEYIGELTLKESMENVSLGAICIVYCGNGIAYYQGEEECGNRPRCLLKSKNL